MEGDHDASKNIWSVVTVYHYDIISQKLIAINYISTQL